jgi:putative oxidoreductase
MGTTYFSAGALAARLALAALFVPSGFAKIAGFTGLAGYIASKGVPLPELCAAIAIAAELGLGLLLLFGYQTRWAALGLGIFVIVITPIFHNYWGVPPEQVTMQKLMFFKNVAIAGALLLLAGAGSGRWSVDQQRLAAA